MLLADFQRAELLMLAGFVMLGWVLIRRSIGRRKRSFREGREADRALERLRNPRASAVPLSDAPPDTQRWQVAMFDLQRELKGELDSRIAIVQSLLRQLDQRIEELRTLQAATADADDNGSETSKITVPPPADQHRVMALAGEGFSAEQIARQTGLPIGDVELICGAFKRQ